MKITDKILTDIGFEYDKERDEFVLELPSFTIQIIKTDKYWMHSGFKHPGYIVETVTDIITLISSYSFKLGIEKNIRDIKNALGI